jgi:hypothetical protein
VRFQILGKKKGEELLTGAFGFVDGGKVPSEFAPSASRVVSIATSETPLL